MREEVIIEGHLRTLRYPAAYRKPANFFVELSGQPIELLLGERFTEGAYVCLAMRRDSDNAYYSMQGQLDIFKKQVVTSYYQNECLVSQDDCQTSYHILLGGDPIVRRIAEHFEHSLIRTYYDHGWWKLYLTKMW